MRVQADPIRAGWGSRAVRRLHGQGDGEPLPGHVPRTCL